LHDKQAGEYQREAHESGGPKALVEKQPADKNGKDRDQIIDHRGKACTGEPDQSKIGDRRERGGQQADQAERGEAGAAGTCHAGRIDG